MLSVVVWMLEVISVTRVLIFQVQICHYRVHNARIHVLMLLVLNLGVSIFIVISKVDALVPSLRCAILKNVRTYLGSLP